MSERSNTEAPQVERDPNAQAVEQHGTSWTGVIYGWLAALGAGLILSGIVSATVGAILSAIGVQGGAQEGGIAALVGLLVTLFLAFLIGGYVAGRMAGRQGLKHGLLVPLLSLIVTIVLALIGGALGTTFIDQLSGVTLPVSPQQAQQAAPQVVQQNLGVFLSVAGILALVIPFVGGAIGGPWGAKRTVRA